MDCDARSGLEHDNHMSKDIVSREFKIKYLLQYFSIEKCFNDFIAPLFQFNSIYQPE